MACRGAVGVAAAEIYFMTQDAVEHAVMPLAIPEERAAQHAFPGKACLFQGPLLADVRDLGSGFDPVRLGVSEQVADELPLRFGAVTAAPGFGLQPDTDYPARRMRTIRPSAPGHEPESVVT